MGRNNNKYILESNPSMIDFAGALLFIFPAYVANAVPVIFTGGGPLDRGAKFLDNKPLFGETKTVFGTLSGITFGALVAMAYPFLGIALFDRPQTYAMVGLGLAVGAMLGDLLGSFAKRRLGFSEGSSVPFLDQLTFFYVALILAVLAAPESVAYLSMENMLFLTVLTFFMHLATNKLANVISLKKVPW